MHRDTVTGLVGAAILVAAMVGVFYYERGVAADPTPDDVGAARTVTVGGPSLEGTTPVGQSTDKPFALNRTGVTNVTFTLKWTAQAGADTLRLTVRPSAATGIEEGGVSEPEDDGEIRLAIPVNNTTPEGALGVGEWVVTVEFVSAATGTPLPPGVAPGTSDAQVAWAVETGLVALTT